MVRARAYLALGAVVLFLLGGCGLPSGSSPVQVPKNEVPYGLLEPATQSPTPTLTPGVPLSAATIFLADGLQRLVPVDVQLPTATLPLLVQSVLNRLAVGPSERERATGLVTDLAPGTTLVLRGMSAGTATIELQQAGQDPPTGKQVVAVGQIVLTATSVVGVDRVQFVKEGTLIQVPVPPAGNLTLEPLLDSTYSALLVPGQTPVTRTTPVPLLPTPSTTTSP